jgi:hypothetical protein
MPCAAAGVARGHILLGTAQEVPVNPQGGYRDPYGVHEDRYFSDGQPTKLVRDGQCEAYDDPPSGPPPREVVEVPPATSADNSGLRRGDHPADPENRTEFQIAWDATIKW